MIIMISNRKSEINMAAAITGKIFIPVCKPGSNEISNPNVLFKASHISIVLLLVLLGYPLPELMNQDGGRQNRKYIHHRGLFVKNTLLGMKVQR